MQNQELLQSYVDDILMKRAMYGQGDMYGSGRKRSCRRPLSKYMRGKPKRCTSYVVHRKSKKGRGLYELGMGEGLFGGRECAFTKAQWKRKTNPKTGKKYTRCPKFNLSASDLKKARKNARVNPWLIHLAVTRKIVEGVPMTNKQLMKLAKNTYPKYTNIPMLNNCASLKKYFPKASKKHLDQIIESAFNNDYCEDLIYENDIKKDIVKKDIINKVMADNCFDLAKARYPKSSSSVWKTQANRLLKNKECARLGY